MIWPFKKSNRSEGTEVIDRGGPQTAFRIPAASRAQVEAFLQQRDIKLVEPGNDTDVFDLVHVVGVLVDSGVSVHRARGVQVPLTNPQFRILTGLTIAVADGVATLIGDETPWERISSLANTRLVVRYGMGPDAAALAARAPQHYTMMCEEPGLLRLFEYVKRSSAIALSTNDTADETKVAEFIAVGLNAAGSL